MIALTRLNGKELIINVQQILFVEATPDTCLTMQGGERLMVKESVSEVVHRAEAFHRRIGLGAPPHAGGVDSSRVVEGMEVQSWTSQP